MFSVGRLMNPQNYVGAAAVGGGFVAGGFVAAQLPIDNPDVRDAAVIAVGILVAGMAEGNIRLFGMGIAGGGAANLIRRRVIVGA